MPYLGVIEREIDMELALKFKKDKWIDVNDRLPSHEYDWVLVSVVDWKNPRLRLIPMVAERRKGRWASQEDDNGDLEKWFHVRVTHWMPLPDQPRD
jgi:hypothetical protein